ncbi:MAG TPA: ester cyclase [Nitrososphaerales archaeon]|nr:ester cyclase [Nitrososphaerales archaeon]
MSLKENLALIRARYEAVNAHDWKRLQTLYADSILWNDSGLDEPINGSLAVRRRFEAFARGFPDFRWDLDSLFGQGELMCAEFTFRGTHGGPLPFSSAGSAPVTKKPIRVQGSGVYRVQGGKIVESRVYFDRLAVLDQLGIGPKKG